jgi:hypothetical protein
MRYTKQISTGKLIETQGGGNPDNPVHLATLKDNAIAGGIAEADIEAGYEDDAVVVAWLKKEQDDAMTYADKRKAEFPTISELVVALYDTGDKAAIEKRRSDVKAKYPKPE